MSGRTTDQFAELATGVQLCFRSSGDTDAPVLLLIAGLTQDLDVWPVAFVEALVEGGFRVIQFDNRDVGRTRHPTAPPPSKLRLLAGRPRSDGYALDDMAADGWALLDALGIDRAHLVGQSMGGMIAQTMAASEPHRALSLVSLYSTTGHPAVGQAALSTKLLLASPSAKTRDRFIEAHVKMIRHLAGRGYPMDERAERAYAGLHWDRQGGHGQEGTARQIQAILLAGDRTAALRNIIAPTLVINGDHDLIVHPSGGTATANAILGARHIVIPGMGHHLAPALVRTVVGHVISHASSAEGAEAL